MDRNTVVGMVLIFAILVVWTYVTGPTEADLAVAKRTQDSLARVEFIADSLSQIAQKQEKETVDIPDVEISDSIKLIQMSGVFGDFAGASMGTNEEVVVENDLIKVTFNTKGGNVKEVLLKEHFKLEEDEEGNETKIPLYLMEDELNKFEYILPIANAAKGAVNTGDLYFSPLVNGNTATFRADAGNGAYFEQVYSLQQGSYVMDYKLNFQGLNTKFTNNSVQLNWVNYLDKLEKNDTYERRYSSIYYKPLDDDTDYCSCTTDDSEELENIKWVANSNQFFQSALIADNVFKAAKLETFVLEKEDDNLKKLNSELVIPLQDATSQTIAMRIFVGPKNFELLRGIEEGLEDSVAFGWSIFGTINRWIIRPLFNFLSGFIGSRGIVILLLTFIVKAVLYPLTYKMIHSQSKMAALKPEIAKLRDKLKGDSQAVQMETMKMYREYGVNPLGGCFPVMLQMPIWFALYRFFPASIEFRQESFLWATDLSSYDVFARIPEIPFYGDHISLFTILWVVTTIIYTWYNSQFMDYSAQPMMKYMQYAMPVMFIFFFNNFASGLTAYLCMSNILNIAQTVVTKNYLIDKEKLMAKMNKNKEKPKKKSKFQQRLDEAMKQQQQLKDQQAKNKKKK